MRLFCSLQLHGQSPDHPYSWHAWARPFTPVSTSNTTCALNDGVEVRRLLIVVPLPGLYFSLTGVSNLWGPLQCLRLLDFLCSTPYPSASSCSRQ